VVIITHYIHAQRGYHSSFHQRKPSGRFSMPRGAVDEPGSGGGSRWGGVAAAPDARTSTIAMGGGAGRWTARRSARQIAPTPMAAEIRLNTQPNGYRDPSSAVKTAPTATLSTRWRRLRSACVIRIINIVPS